MPVTDTLTRMFQSVLIILAAVWILLALFLYFNQSRFVYYPFKSMDSTPDEIGLSYQDVHLVTEDGIRIHGWYIPHPDPRYTLLFLHGNAGNISHRLESLRIFHALGLSVLIIDYRGYGKSEGKPDEPGTYIDARAAWNYLVDDLRIPANKIIIFGRSLGGAVAVDLSGQVQPAALILESTFTSLYDMGKHYYPYLPIRLLARIKYASIEKIRKIHTPLLVIHSQEDDIVPYELGRRLFEAANQPRQFVTITGDHNYGYLESGNMYINQLDSFISTYIPLADSKP